MPPLSQARCRFHPPGAGKFARNPCQSWGAGKVVTDSGMREPFRNFAKALLAYLHVWEKTKGIVERLGAFRYIETALYEINASVCPMAITPEVLNRACSIASKRLCDTTSSNCSIQMSLIYRYMVDLRLVTVPSEWKPSLGSPNRSRNRVGRQFDEERQRKLPSPIALEALADIFNSNSDNELEIFVSSICALMLCVPDRAVEMLFAPRDLLIHDWTDPKTGEVGTGLRWYPVKGSPPMTKTVIPSMRDIAIRAVDRLKRLSSPAQALALWYEKNPNRIYLPPHLEYLREQHRINEQEIHPILFEAEGRNPTPPVDRNRANRWLDIHKVPRVSRQGINTTVVFGDLERAVLAQLPNGFPVMDQETGMLYSEALCIARESEFDTKANHPSRCCFNRINYYVLRHGLKNSAANKSVFERLNYILNP
jgi:hypothetical protein